jgi:hypothetical protein
MVERMTENHSEKVQFLPRTFNYPPRQYKSEKWPSGSDCWLVWRVIFV